MKNRALGYLARREYAEAELYRKLQPFSESTLQLQELMHDLKAQGYLSDVRFAQQFIEVYSRRFGVRRISYELKQRGLSDETIAPFLDQLNAQEFEYARQVWEKRFGQFKKDVLEREKQKRFLQNRGFSYDSIQRLFSFLDESEE
ncbi:MAG: recombination regulator RecX [Proteobacteria bacterium]|nr:recombination regulator RecX [Pseudomonadota bacterium]MDE3207740.1 recombination regulator RecX [Pseudomonadota bacterium]